jgi:hypothetical protein
VYRWTGNRTWRPSSPLLFPGWFSLVFLLLIYIQFVCCMPKPLALVLAASLGGG